MMKNIQCILIIITVLLFVGCTPAEINESGNNLSNENLNVTQSFNKNEYAEIKFSEMYETKGNEKNVSIKLQELDGKKVAIKGYPAVQSPLDESFLYLNNQPYVTCPFCTIGDITKLEVIPIFMADGSKIHYTENGLIAYGTLEIEAKVDSEGYTTQFRIYADKVEEFEASETDKNVQEYYSLLSEQGMIYDIQNLQMNIEYATNPEYMSYYGENKKDIVSGVIAEYVGYDENYAQNFGEEYSYLVYIMECPAIVKYCEPEDEKLKVLNNELIELYNNQILLLEKFEKVVYKYNGKELTDAEIEVAYNEFVDLNDDNLELYNKFTAWNNKLRE